MKTSSRASLLSILGSVPDRRRHNRVHPLSSVLALAVCAMLCGARSLYAIFQWGRDNAELIAEPLGFTRGKPPCHASLHYIFADLDANAFEMALYSFFRQYCDGKKLKGVSIDGKKLRGIHGEELPCITLVSAFAHELGIPLLQRGVQPHEGELTTARDLLQVLTLKNVVITGDSLYCQRDVCETIVEKGGIT